MFHFHASKYTVQKNCDVFLLWYNCIRKCMINVLIGCCSSVVGIGNLDVRSLLIGAILCMFCWLFATALGHNSHTKVLGGVLTSSIILLRTWNSKPCNFTSSSQTWQGNETNAWLLRLPFCCNLDISVEHLSNCSFSLGQKVRLNHLLSRSHVPTKHFFSFRFQLTDSCCIAFLLSNLCSCNCEIFY